MSRPVRIPSDINRPDKILGPFTGRQVAILAATTGALYLAWLLARTVVELRVFLLAATPFAALGILLAVGQRDGLPLERLLLAAIRYRLTHRPQRQHRDTAADRELTGPGWLTENADLDIRPDAEGGRVPRRPARFPAQAVTTAGDPHDTDDTSGGAGGVGVIDLGADGLVVVAAVTTVNLALRTPAEQDGLIDTFARYLHTLTAPVQILVRAVPLDLAHHLHQLHTHARDLPHPALIAAADAHRAHLAQLAARRDEHELLTRQVLLVLREPARATGARGPGRGAEHRLLRRLGDAATLLAALDVTVTPLTAAQTTDLLAGITNPDHPTDDPSRQPGQRPHRRRHNPPTTAPVPDTSPPRAASPPAADAADAGWGPADDRDREAGRQETGYIDDKHVTDTTLDGYADMATDDTWPDTDDPQQARLEGTPNDDGDPTYSRDPIRYDELDDEVLADEPDDWDPDPWSEPLADQDAVGRSAR